MNNATRFYIKESTASWTGTDELISIADHLETNKFYVDGWFKKKIFNAMIWLMKKLDVKALWMKSETKTFILKSYTIHQNDILELIKKHKIDMNYIWREDPKYLVIGQDVFQKLFNDPALQFGMIQTEIPYYINKIQYDTLDNPIVDKQLVFWGFKIIVVPWINGCFLLPSI